MNGRFSKATLRADIQKRLDSLEAIMLEDHGHEIDGLSGYIQVRGKGEELNGLYGEYHALKELLEDI